MSDLVRIVPHLSIIIKSYDIRGLRLNHAAINGLQETI